MRNFAMSTRTGIRTNREDEIQDLKGMHEVTMWMCEVKPSRRRQEPAPQR
jgi:hypothetical protein